MLALVVGRKMRAERSGNTWIAADLELTDDDLLVGVIGYETVEVFTNFNEEEWSWLKGPQRTEEGASGATLSPFAVDLHEDRRWVCFGPSGRLNRVSFPGGFQAVMNEALRQQNEGFSDWEVDIVSSGTALREWVSEHHEITRLVLTIRRPNPGRDLSEDLQRMARLRARTKTEEYSPEWGGTLDLPHGELDDLTADMAKTNVDVKLTAREGTSNARFDSKHRVEQRFVEDYGNDMRLGMELVADALRAFSAEHTGERHGSAEEGDIA